MTTDTPQTQQLQTEMDILRRDRDRFFSIMSHDLRGSVASLPDYLKMIIAEIDQYEPDEAKKMLEIAYRTSLNSSALLSSLLQWANVQRDKTPYSPQVVQLGLMAKKALHTLMPIIEQKQLQVTIDIDDNIGLYADQYMISIILHNLLDNACKFNHDQGTISVTANTHQDLVTTTITDTGIGIKNNQLGKLFSIDNHYGTQGTAKESGTGMGLAICQQMLDKHNSQLMINSTLDEGTTISFTLPHYRAEI